MVGLGDAFIYSKGVLCYILDDIVRILDIHHSDHQETVVSIPGLLTRALSGIEHNTTGYFNILHYSNFIVSSIYISADEDSSASLISFNIYTRRIEVVKELDSTDKIFVRNNEQFLYYGTHSGLDHDGHKKWILRGYNLKRQRWFDQDIYLSDLVGSDIGSTICFELYEDYFYALSNQSSFEVEEIDWTSFYHCVRFPLNSPCQELLEKTENRSMWRRQHHEGPIDDRWTVLRLDIAEATNEIKIVETRKEWHLGSSNSLRTYYTTEIKFPSLYEKNEVETAYRTDTALISSTPALGTDASQSSITSTSSTGRIAMSTTHANFEYLPDDPLTKLLRPDDKPMYMRPPPRCPEYTHPGYDGISATHTLTKSRVRHYHTSSMAFLDLVDDPLPTDVYSTQRLRLRVGSRKLGPPLFHPLPKGKQGLGLCRAPSTDVNVAVKEMYQDLPINYWPAAQDPIHPNKELDALYSILNPPSHLGDVEGVMDDRSIIYATGGRNAPRALIFIGFDPVMRLQGLKMWGVQAQAFGQNGGGDGAHIVGQTVGLEVKQGSAEDVNPGVDERDRIVGIDRKGKGKSRSTSAMQLDVEANSKTGRDVYGRWIWKDAAMFLSINRGYQFD